MTRAILVLVALLAVSPAFAQQAARPAAPAAPAATTDAQLHLIVVDVTESGIPTANITITAPGREPIEVMTAPNAAPMTTATARSMTLPRSRKSRNSRTTVCLPNSARVP